MREEILKKHDDNRQDSPNIDLRLVIGIVAQEADEVFEGLDNYSYIPSSYVKYVESAGGLALPIRTRRETSYYREVFESVHGVIFPGGNVNVYDSEYSRICSLFYEWAIEANESGTVFPVLGICLGFEQILFLAAGDENPLSDCDGINYNTNLIPTKEWDDCELLRSIPDCLRGKLTKDDLCYNNHEFCVRLETFEKNGRLKDKIRIGALSKDSAGHNTFIAYIEFKTLPIYAVQFHPEKSIFEWACGVASKSRFAVRSAQHFINHFMDKASECNHKFQNTHFKSLSINYSPVATASILPIMQCYLFDDSSKSIDATNTTKLNSVNDAKKNIKPM